MFLISRTQNEATSNSTCLICFLTRHSRHEVFHGRPTQTQTTTMHTSLSTFAIPQQLILIFYIFKIFIIWLSTVILILQGQVQRRREFLEKKKTKQNKTCKQRNSKAYIFPKFCYPRRNVPRSGMARLHALWQRSSRVELLALQCSTHLQGQEEKTALYGAMETSGQVAF